MSPARLRLGALLLGALLASCASNKPKPSGSTVAASDTPEVPYQPKPAPAAQPPPPANAQPAPAAAPAAAAKPAPAPVKEEPPPPPAAPVSKIPARERQAFEHAVDVAMKHDVMAAEHELKQLVDQDPALDYAWTNLGVIYEREALPDQAEKAYKKALEVKPDQDVAWDYLTRLYCRTGRATQMEVQLRLKIQDFPGSLGLRTALVFALLHQNKFESAANEAKKVLKGDERNVHAMQLLAQVYYRQGKNELSKMVLENARAIDPRDAATLNALGLVNLSLKSRPQALEYFRQASEAKADFAEAKNNYGALLNESQDFETAAKVLEDAVNAAPDFYAARLNLGNAYRGKQDFAKAITQYKQVVRLKPDLADIYFNLAILHLDSEVPNLDPVERLQTAITYFNQYRQKGGQDDRIEQYIKDANKGIEKEQRKKEREKKDQLRKAEKDAAEKRKADEDRQAADRKAAADQAEADRKAAADRAASDQKAAAERAQADRQAAADEAARKKRQDEEDRKARAAEAKRSAAKLKEEEDAAPPPPKPTRQAPASKLKEEEDPAPKPAPTPQPAKPSSGKLGDDDK